MCGIAGYWQKSELFGHGHLQTMAASLAHRGPDNEGIYCSATAGLAHRRLSIIDLNEHANQPFYSADGRYIMVYNGEVYNFKALAAQFQITPRTHSDTEIILELFAKRGVDFVNLLNGMFAIAIYDTTEQRLFLFRDRAGIKPLFYFFDGEAMLFASELKAIKAAMSTNGLSLNYEAVGTFLHLGFIPAPATIYKDVFKLRPGHFAMLDKNGLIIRQWWNIERKIQEKRLTNEKEILHRLDNAVNSAVKTRLISDVPVGTFLSGGVDSSLVSAVAARHFNDRLKTFTIGFEHATHNEAEFAKKVAQHIGCEHRVLFATDNEARELLPDIITQYDEPFADTSAISTMLVSRMAKNEVAVALSGDGGDELFMGYGAHVWAKRLAQIQTKIARPASKQLLQIGNSRMRRVAHLFEKNINAQSHIFSQEQYLFSQSEVSELLIFPSEHFEAIRFNAKNLKPAEKQALFDFMYYLPDDLLTKIDRASMRYGLETRVPMLDYRIAELAFNLHPNLRLRGKIGKYILKKLLYQYVPEQYFDRPKHGFSVPLYEWMTGSLKDWFETYLDKSMIEKHQLVNPEYVIKLRKRFEKSSNRYLYNRIWAIAALHAWLDGNV